MATILSDRVRVVDDRCTLKVVDVQAFGLEVQGTPPQLTKPIAEILVDRASIDDWHGFGNGVPRLEKIAPRNNPNTLMR